MSINRTRVLITIDTEFSIGGYFLNKDNKPVPADRHIYCKINGKDYGINLIMDMLDKYNFKGVFFVETEARFYFGEKEIINIIQNIKARGHEVQLHIHPNYNSFYKGRTVSDDMRRYSVEDQTNIITDALTFLSSNEFNDILAYRSGSFYSNLNTIKALQNNGIKYSSNYNLAYRNCDYIAKYQNRNDIFCIEGVFEVPITCYKETPIRKEWNSLQVSATSYKEFIKALDHYYQQHYQLINIITHSFEFVKPYDVQYTRISPKQYLIKRFDKICNFLACHPDKYEIITYEELDKLINNNEVHTTKESSHFYNSSFLDTSKRYIENYVCHRLIS